MNFDVSVFSAVPVFFWNSLPLDLGMLITWWASLRGHHVMRLRLTVNTAQLLKTGNNYLVNRLKIDFFIVQHNLILQDYPSLIEGVCRGIEGVCRGIEGVCRGIEGVCRGIEGVYCGIDGACRGIEGVYCGIEGECRGIDRKSTRLNSSHSAKSRMPSSA